MNNVEYFDTTIWYKEDTGEAMWCWMGCCSGKSPNEYYQVEISFNKSKIMTEFHLLYKDINDEDGDIELIGKRLMIPETDSFPKMEFVGHNYFTLDEFNKVTKDAYEMFLREYDQIDWTPCNYTTNETTVV